MKKLFENWRKYTKLSEGTQWTQYRRITDMLKGDVESVNEISVLTPENPHAKQTPKVNPERTELFLQLVSQAGYGYRQIDGMYSGSETSYVIPHMSKEEAAGYSYMFGQESFVYTVKQVAEEPILHQLIVIDGYEAATQDPQYDFTTYGAIYSVPPSVQTHVDVQSNDLVEFGQLMNEPDFYSSVPDKNYIDDKTGEAVNKPGPRFKMDFYPDEPKDIVIGKPTKTPGSGPKYMRETFVHIDSSKIPDTPRAKKLAENIRKRSKLIVEKDRIGSSKYHHRKMIIKEKKELKKLMEEK